MAAWLSCFAKKGARPLRYLFRGGIWICLAVWLLVRLWVPFGGVIPGRLLAPAALLLSGAVCILAVRFRLTETVFQPWGSTWRTLLAGLAAFGLGAVFDISYHMFQAEGHLIIHPLLRLLCHMGNGSVFAAIVLALLWSLRQLTGLAGRDLRQLLVLWAVANLFTAFFVLTSKTVYFWDTAGYWSTATSLAGQPLSYEQVRQVLVTTLTMDYNHLLAWPISLLMRIFGPSRAVFLFAITNLYAFPGLWGLWVLGRNKRFAPVFLAGLFPMFLYMGLVGFVDVAACSLGIWAYVVYTSGAPALPRGLVGGFLLAGTFALRRYFFFFALSFGAAALLVKLIFSRKDWTDFLALLCSSAVCTLSFMYAFLLEKVLGNNYGDLYSAYAEGIYADFLRIFRYFGVIPLAGIGIAALLLLAGTKARADICFAASQILVCFVAFVTIQTHGQQHLLLYVPGLALLASIAFEQFPVSLPCLVLALVTSAYCFIPKVQPTSTEEIRGFALLPSFQFYGEKRSDIDTLVALADFVDALSDESPHTAGVLSSSLVFNVEVLTNLRPSLSLPQPRNQTQLISSGEVDKRDAFNWNLAFADYLLVGDPVQTHLGEENQQLVALPAHWVLEGIGPGQAYQPLSQSFPLLNGCVVRVYQRTRDWAPEEFQMLSLALQTLYPDYAWLYALPAW